MFYHLLGRLKICEEGQKVSHALLGLFSPTTLPTPGSSKPAVYFPVQPLNCWGDPHGNVAEVEQSFNFGGPAPSSSGSVIGPVSYLSHFHTFPHTLMQDGSWA